MGDLRRVLLFSGILLIALQFVKAVETTTFVYALPTTPLDSESVGCPSYEAQCSTLQELSTSHNFTSNSTLVLLPGVHNITANGSLTIENIINFEIIGYSDIDLQSIAIIRCSNNSLYNINLQNATGVRFMGLKIHGCTAYGEKISIRLDNSVFDRYYMTCIKITNSSHISMENVEVYNSTGVGLLLHQVYHNVSIVNSEFSYNWRGCMIISKLNNLTRLRLRKDVITFIHLEISGTKFRNNRDESWPFEYTGGLVIDLNTEVDYRFEVLIHNLTIHNKDRAHNLGLHLRSRSTVVSKASLDNIISARPWTTLSEGENKGHNGVKIELAGKVYTKVEDCNFIGPVIVYLPTSPEGKLLDRTKKLIHFTRVVFTGVKCSNCAGVLTFRDIDRAKIEAITVKNCLLLRGAIVATNSSILFVRGKSVFKSNNVGISLLANSYLIFSQKTTTIFENNVCSSNVAQDGSILGVENSYVVLFNSSVVFRNNTATTSALLLYNSKLGLFNNSTLLFDGNIGVNGGAMSLYSKSQVQVCSGQFFEDYYLRFSIHHIMQCHRNSESVVFQNNYASQKGGAVFIDDSTYFTPAEGPLYSYMRTFHIRSDQSKFSFINNVAEIAGSAIYGGWNMYTALQDQFSFDQANNPDDLSVVASNPVRVCLCDSQDTPNVPNCTTINHAIETYPGKTVSFNAVAVGESFGTVPYVVHTQLITKHSHSEVKLGEGQHSQIVTRQCTTVRYNFHSLYPTEKVLMRLTVDKVSTPNLEQFYTMLKLSQDYDEPDITESIIMEEVQLLMQQLSVTITSKNCPLGFSFDVDSKKCTCHQVLAKYNNIFVCDIETLEVTKPSEKWINATFIHNLDNDTGVIISDYCPFDYCKKILTQISLNLEYPNDQCDFNRSGILCGECQSNFSNVLGTSKCKECFGVWTLVLVPIAGIMGVLLIALMLALYLNVSTGMLNGLVLYANIIRANNTIFFKSGSFLSTFIAWLNLDLGIEVCFYNGLDAYVKTWLQFIFPLYIWTIMIILVALSRRYVFVTRLCGPNVVQVLATLFLLSYAKLIRTIITIFQSTTLTYPNGYRRRVWLYDGNVDYLKGKHIPLFIAGLTVLLCLSIPYTVSLLFIQWLRKFNHHRLLRWVGKLKPLFDAYTGPFKEKHCYWFGVLLLVRVALYLVFSLNVSGDTSLNLMAIGTTSLCVFSYLVMVGGVYESTLANGADVSFMLNLGLLTMGAHFYNNPQRMSTISVSIAFCQFVLITFYHLYLRIIETRRGRHLKEKLQTKMKQYLSTHKVMREYFAPSVQTRTDISHSSIELKEPLLVDITRT